MSLQGTYYYLHFTDVKTEARGVMLPAQRHPACSPRPAPQPGLSQHTTLSPAHDIPRLCLQDDATKPLGLGQIHDGALFSRNGQIRTDYPGMRQGLLQSGSQPAGAGQSTQLSQKR